MAMASWLIVRDYFGQQPSIANTLLACGFPVGVFIFSLISDVLYQNFSYFGAFIISAAIMMNCFVCALLFRPFSQVKMKGVMRETSVYEQMSNPVENIRYTPNGTAGDKPAGSSSQPETETSDKHDRESLNPRDGKSYKSVEGPTESIVVSATAKSFKFDDTVLYESEDDDDVATNKEKADKPKEETSVPVEEVNENKPDEVDGITNELHEEELKPIGPTLLEVVVGLSDITSLCNWRLLLYILAGMVYSLGFGVPFCMYPDVARFRGES